MRRRNSSPAFGEWLCLNAREKGISAYWLTDRLGKGNVIAEVAMIRISILEEVMRGVVPRTPNRARLSL